MNAPAKLATFGTGLAVLFGGGALAGAAIGPDRADDQPVAAAHGHPAETRDRTNMAATDTETSTAPADVHGGHGTAAASADPVRGLAVAEDGLQVVVEDADLHRGRREQLRFRIVDDRGQTVRDFDVEHTKLMHLIIARRDLTGFQHLHPVQRADGSWSTDVVLRDAGSYRLFADFSTAQRPQTLATDLRVDGPAELRPLPAAVPAAVSDGGYDVGLDAAGARAGQEAELRFTITKDGAPVHVQPYLGADGHLVALRDGDLAFLHVHPTGHGNGEDAGTEAHDDSIGFAATFPTAGRYRLFLQFQHEGQVQTVAFTQEVTR